MRFTSLFPFLLSLATAVSAAEIGGTFPWRTLQAEEAETNAERLKPSRRAGDFAAECVGKSGVRLNRAGDYVEFTAPAAANSIVVRYAIPDAPRGGGEEHTLSGYVDGKHRFDLKLSSRHTWLYGKEHDPVNDPEELKRLPGTVARRFFDEARLLTGPIPAGAKIRLQKDASDTARYYVIDLIDLEEVPPPIPRPENSLSVKEFGAVGDGLFDDSDAIARCLDAAAKQKKTVYLPPGVYRTSRRFAIDEIAIQGAGMWYTTILNRRDNLAEKSNGVGFQVNGRSTLRDFAIHGDGTRRGEESHPLRGDWGKGSLVENLWIEQAECGVWVGRDNQPGPEELTVRNCRFRNLLADGINLCAGTQNSVVENCHARGTGDDSFAIWAAPKGRLASSNNVIRNCTAEAPWRARCFAIFGGSNNRVENCVGRDTLTSGGLTATTEFDSWPLGGTTVFRNIRLERCGGWFWNGLPYGTIVLRAEKRDYLGEVLFENITAIDNVNTGITVIWGEKNVQKITFRNVVFDGIGRCGVEIFRDSRGEIKLDNVRFLNNAGPLQINASADKFRINGLPAEQ